MILTHRPDESFQIIGDTQPLDVLMYKASILRDIGHGSTISYSRKVFIPLTQLCRDVCHYCTFAQAPKDLQSAYLDKEQVLSIARAGVAAGCHEALFTLGDKPELRYAIARSELAKKGHATTLSYLTEMCSIVYKETGLLPHVNPGVMTKDDISDLRRVSISQGIMLESLSARLTGRGHVHYGSPDKSPEMRLATIREAGIQKVPFTTGILIGIGETRHERIDSLLAIRQLHEEFGHIQEVIIQNFRAKPRTKMAHSKEPSFDDLLWTVAMARLIFGPEMNIQAPPNLSPQYPDLINAGLNDWGGISPVTKDFVNPEAPWPHLEALRVDTEKTGKVLTQRLSSYPDYCRNPYQWHEHTFVKDLLRLTDGQGLVRDDNWSPGISEQIPHYRYPVNRSRVEALLSKSFYTEDDIATLFKSRGEDCAAICQAADELRAKASGDIVHYVVNRNINYTNVCYFKCQFCAFSKGKHDLRGLPYDIEMPEIIRRATEAWERGATEICMQGGIHPAYTGDTYISLCREIKSVLPKMHIHAFSPLEVWMGAQTLNISLLDYLHRLRDAGLGTLPGTAAEILDDEIRAIICPDKINTAQWLEVMETAHKVGFNTTSTIMFGHVEGYSNWARHLLRIRNLQEKTGGFTEFVPLPFIHMEAPMYMKGKSRKGPTYRETILMHAIARLVLHPLITNIQVSWVKMGVEGSKACLQAGANDLGGTLMNESISRAAGTSHGQEMPPLEMEKLLNSIGRKALQRTTQYGTPDANQQQRSYSAEKLSEIVLTPLKKKTDIANKGS